MRARLLCSSSWNKPRPSSNTGHSTLRWACGPSSHVRRWAAALLLVTDGFVDGPRAEASDLVPQRQRAAQEPATVLIAHGEGDEPAVLAALASLRASLGGRGPTLRFASAERPGALLVLGAVGAQVGAAAVAAPRHCSTAGVWRCGEARNEGGEHMMDYSVCKRQSRYRCLPAHEEDAATRVRPLWRCAVLASRV